MVEEPLQKMPHQQRKLAALWGNLLSQRGLRVERERLRLRHHEQSLELLTHSQFASPPPSPARRSACPAASPVAQIRSPGWAGSSTGSDLPDARLPESF